MHARASSRKRSAPLGWRHFLLRLVEPLIVWRFLELIDEVHGAAHDFNRFASWLVSLPMVDLALFAAVRHSSASGAYLEAIAYILAIDVMQRWAFLSTRSARVVPHRIMLSLTLRLCCH